MRMKRIAVWAALMALAVSFAVARAEPTDAGDGFVRAEGRELVCGGEPYLIKGMAMGNDVWNNPSAAPAADHDESAFRELAAMGFNSVRFYLNYALFEDDADPYRYREEGFGWLDRNIRWARANGIRLILNMHYPQGGYQSQGNGDRLWKEPENRNRLAALWGEIARRYADEETVIGYGLVNEPMPVGGTNTRDGLRVWQELAQQITDEIRRYDDRHVIFVEKVLGVRDPKTGETDWNLPFEEQFVPIRDDNAVYEFHTYDPHSFTHQGFDWAGRGGTAETYPNDELYASGVSWLAFTAAGRARAGSTDWQPVSGGLISVTDPNTNAVALCFQASGIGKDASVYADDLWIDVFDEIGELIRSVPCETAEYHGNFSFWAQNGEGSGTVSSRYGYDDRRSLCIKGTTGDANMTLIRLKHTPGRKYKVRGYVRTEGAAASSLIALRLDSYHAQSIQEGSRALLLGSVRDAQAFSRQTGRPVFCGEFGAGIHCFEEGRGGERWVTDSIEALKECGIGFNYHAYYDGAFGLYYEKNGKRIRNDVLEQVFRDHIAD